MDKFKELLIQEVGYNPGEDAIDSLLALTETVELEAGDIIVDTGEMDTHVYIVKDGIIRYVDMNGVKERTYAFATVGTLFSSYISFRLHKPSYYRIEACCHTELLRMSEQDFWNLVGRNHKVSTWMLNLSYGQLAFMEQMQATVKNGSAKERFMSMMKNRPEIALKVSQKAIASYLDITPEYLSRMKRIFQKNQST